MITSSLSNRPIGITIIAVLTLILALIYLFLSGVVIVLIIQRFLTGHINTVTPDQFKLTLNIFIGIFGLIVSIGLFRLKKWAFWIELILTTVALMTAV